MEHLKELPLARFPGVKRNLLCGLTVALRALNGVSLLGLSNVHRANIFCKETGALPYKTLKQAITELSGDDIAESNARLEAWWAFNKLYQDVLDDDIPVEEKDFNRSNMQWLLSYYSKKPIAPYSLVFELHRLLGNIDKYKRLLGEMTYERFIEWRKERNQKKGIESSLDEQQLKRMYERFIEDKESALNKPLKPYVI